MGWCSGSHMAESLWDNIKPYLKEEDYQTVVQENYDGSLWSIAHPEEYLEHLEEELPWLKKNEEWDDVEKYEELII